MLKNKLNFKEKENEIMGLTSKPFGRTKRILKRLESNQMREKQAMKFKKKEKK